MLKRRSRREAAIQVIKHNSVTQTDQKSLDRLDRGFFKQVENSDRLDPVLSHGRRMESALQIAERCAGQTGQA